VVSVLKSRREYVPRRVVLAPSSPPSSGGLCIILPFTHFDVLPAGARTTSWKSTSKENIWDFLSPIGIPTKIAPNSHARTAPVDPLRINLNSNQP
jgi:hypothetical protein